MSEDLSNEIEAINSIYGDNTIQPADDASMDIYILSIPQHQVSLRLSIPPQYPEVPIQLLGTETSGDSSRKGHGSHVLHLAQETLQAVFTPGSVCLFDLLQELDNTLAAEETLANRDDDPSPTPQAQPTFHSPTNPDPFVLHALPTWTLSSPLTEKKSLFLARACPVTSPAHAHAAISHLLAHDKRAAKATHNISAYRIRCPSSTTTTSKATPAPQITYQDCDDDGETAAGGRLLHLLQVMEVWGVLVVVSRWYGGVKLGPDRFRCITGVAREAVVRGGWGGG